MQHQTTYYRTVPVSEKPKKSGYYLTPLGKVYYSSRKESFTVRKPTHYLQPIPLPDAAVLREALEKIVKDVSAVIPERIPVDDKLLVLLYNVKWTAQQALSAVGDGWIEIKEGCDMPYYGDSVLVIIPNHGDEYFNAFTAKYEGDGFYVKKRRVDDKYFAGEPSHWRPLPPQPINK